MRLISTSRAKYSVASVVFVIKLMQRRKNQVTCNEDNFQLAGGKINAAVSDPPPQPQLRAIGVFSTIRCSSMEDSSSSFRCRRCFNICTASLGQVKKATEKSHRKNTEIVGVSVPMFAVWTEGAEFVQSIVIRMVGTSSSTGLVLPIVMACSVEMSTTSSSSSS